MADVQHSVLETVNLHKAAYWGSTDPGAVGAGIFWVDTAAGATSYVLKVRNTPNNGWDTVISNLLSDGTNSSTAAEVRSHLDDAADGGAKVWHHKLDDTVISTTKVWSSDKVNTDITAHTGTASIHRSINDAGVSSTDLFSAAHIIALLNILEPVGSIKVWPALAVPNGQWCVCDGRTFNPAVYPALFSVIGTNWGTDGVGNPRIPDLRSVFLRGGAYGRGLDPDVASRTAMYPGGASGDAIGSYEADSLASHVHSFHNTYRVAPNNGSVEQGDAFWNFRDETGSTGATGTGETRPKNVMVNFMIRLV